MIDASKYISNYYNMYYYANFFTFIHSSRFRYEWGGFAARFIYTYIDIPGFISMDGLLKALIAHHIQASHMQQIIVLAPLQVRLHPGLITLAISDSRLQPALVAHVIYTNVFQYFVNTGIYLNNKRGIFLTM